ncbi:MAG: hypothetical protein MUD14_09990 [Hydrococcus sp. Prado102]|nr:hypothetical protein [Hydrococcus sp. Prado102]
MLKDRIQKLVNQILGHSPTPIKSIGKHPDWESFLQPESKYWKSAIKKAKGGPKVLIATSTGGHTAVTPIESLLAVALTLRGASVHILLCDEFLPACLQAWVKAFPDQEEFVKDGPKNKLCEACFAPAYQMYRSLGLPVHRYSDFITPQEAQAAKELAYSFPYDKIGDYELDGLAVGEHALAGALRFYAKGNLEDEPNGEAILRRYFEASLLTTYVTRRLLNTDRFSSACFHHGIYVPQGLIGEVARKQGTRVVNWCVAYRKQCFIFSHGDTYHHTLLSEPTTNWENIPWTPQMEADILEYLKSRWQGTQDWIWFHEKPEEKLSAIASELGIDFSRPCIGMLTNVMWDAQLHYRANAFPNMLEWVLQTIRYFEKRPELQLILRIHPAEIRGSLPSRQPILAEIHKTFPTLPSNIFIIPPESQVSTYAVMEVCNAVLIYGTKTGVELTSMGIPVIVGGEAWIRNKGITLDASSVQEYFELLDRLPFGERLNETLTQRARQYAYHFFFRRMIPLKCIEPTEGSPPYKINFANLNALLPGQERGLDVICDGILKGSEFIYPAEVDRVH